MQKSSTHFNFSLVSVIFSFILKYLKNETYFINNLCTLNNAYLIYSNYIFITNF